ncbi:MAG: hypothetical protein RMY62_014320 [Nostoc sp. ZfuVER08]|jgi:hypothetical protein|uniref:Uncharacterized protein n=1 Tax=Nostoc punctiforme FACHB-252 TaxID=1357509 RepID=A0ABR8H5F6_NOSPU|nr:hypothetical protein [Nostoc punctiforme]MBD2610445.1 hypothetical protein [Nostoc punctiforme FACHB-252]MDZ8012838.1 hypothetical protein [Nostoc sp. ZfuVER08]
MKTALMQIWRSSIGSKLKLPLIIFNWSVRAASRREATLLVYFSLPTGARPLETHIKL